MNEPLSRRIVPSELATVLGDTEMQSGILAATSIGLFSLAFLLVASILRAFGIFPMELYQWSVVGLVFLAAFVMGGIIFLAWLRSRGHRERVARWAAPENKLENTAPTPAPTLPTTPNTPERMIPHNIGGRAGELAVDLIDGWLDPRDADWFAQYLANKNKWTEALLEKMPLHYTTDDKGVPLNFGKDRDKPPSPYHKLMVKCVSMEIIGNRGGPGNYTGDLLITDKAEIAKRLKTTSPPE